MDTITRYINIRTVLGVALGGVFLMTKSKPLRYGILAAVVLTYFILPKDSDAGRTAREGIADFTDRLPGIGGTVSHWIVK